MMGTLFTALVTALSLLIVDLVVPGVDIANFPAALIAGLVIGALNVSVKPALSVLSLPINFATLGGFSLIVNGFCLWLAAVLVPGFGIHGLVGFILAPVILSSASTFLNKYFAERKMLAGSNTDLKTQA